MQSTIVWTKEGHAIRITDTVLTTITAIGGGQLAAGYVTWAINPQLKGANEVHHVTDTQVRRAMNDIIRYGWLRGLVNQGHGVYRWHRGQAQ